jgi:molybdate transport system substrate-binding protein
MKFAIEEITEKFTEKSGLHCSLIISCSGQLAAQIKEKAPYDLFVSADMKYPREVFNSGLAVLPPEIYARGSLVLWTKFDEITPSIDSLSVSSVRNIAIPNPRLAPYGTAAIEVLKNNEIFEKVENKLIYGQSISQTDQFILTKSAEIGFTALSTVLSPKMRGVGQWIRIDKKDYSPIDQGAVLIKRKKVNPNAHAFYNYLFSSEAKEILNNSGYFTDE